MRWLNTLIQELRLLRPDTKVMQSLMEENADLKRRLEEEQEKSMTDALTRARNRMYFDANIALLFSIHERTEKSLALLYLDLDNFKDVNNACGHYSGDEALIKATQIFQQVVRDSDIVVRLGGDEFVIIATNVTDKKSLHSLSERLHKGIDAMVIEGCSIKISLSIGVYLVEKNEKKMVLTPQEALNLADKAMYISKDSGRNQTTFA